MRTVHVKAIFGVDLHVKKGSAIMDVVNELDCSFSDTTTRATIEDSNMDDYDIIRKRPAHVKLTFDLTIKADDDADIEDIINEMDYDIKDTTGNAEIQDTCLDDFTVTDSR